MREMRIQKNRNQTHQIDRLVLNLFEADRRLLSRHHRWVSSPPAKTQTDLKSRSLSLWKTNAEKNDREIRWTLNDWMKILNPKTKNEEEKEEERVRNEQVWLCFYTLSGRHRASQLRLRMWRITITLSLSLSF